MPATFSTYILDCRSTCSLGAVRAVKVIGGPGGGASGRLLEDPADRLVHLVREDPRGELRPHQLAAAAIEVVAGHTAKLGIAAERVVRVEHRHTGARRGECVQVRLYPAGDGLARRVARGTPERRDQ